MLLNEQPIRIRPPADSPLLAIHSVWIPDDEEAFVSASVLEPATEPDSVVVTLESGAFVRRTPPRYSQLAHRQSTQRTVEKLDLSPVNPTAYDGSPDIADLPYLNEASVLHNLKTRYSKSAIYVRSRPEIAQLRLFTFSESDLLRPLPRRRQSVSISTHLHSSSDRKCVFSNGTARRTDD